MARALCLQINNPKIDSGSLKSYINNPSPLDEPIDVLVAGAGAGAGSGSGSSAGAGDPSASDRVKDLKVIGPFLDSIIFPASPSTEDMIRIVIESVCLLGMKGSVNLHLPTVILEFVRTAYVTQRDATRSLKSLADILKIRIPG